MRGSTHIVAGAVAAVGLNLVTGYIPLHPPETLALVALANVVGSLLPDIDSSESVISHATGSDSHPDWTARRWARLIGLRRDSKQVVVGLLTIVLGVFSLITGIFRKLALRGHRGLTHTLIVPILFVAVFPLLGKPGWGIAFLLGYATHLLGDAMTRSGIPVLWPLTDSRYHLLPRPIQLRTGSPAEHALMALLCLGLGLGLWQMVPKG